MDVDRLRTETRAEHEAVEALVPLMQPDLTREQYIQTLRRMYTVVHGWESWAAAHAPEPYGALVVERRRSHLIAADLESLGVALASVETDDISEIEARLTKHFLRFDVDHLSSAPDFLGAMYVMEGSTLGGQYIARYVEEKLAMSQGRGNAYFRGYAERTGSMWQSFKQQLAAVPEADADRVIAAAKFMFGAFGAAMAQDSEELFAYPNGK